MNTKPTNDQLEEIYELLELLPTEARRTIVGGYVSDLTAAQATAVIPQLHAAVKNLPRATATSAGSPCAGATAPSAASSSDI